jgi:hypothetical protein
VAQRTERKAGRSLPAQDAPPRRREDGRPAAAYTWHVAAGGVLVVVDLDPDGWRSVTNDAWDIVSELAELRPDLAYGSVPCIVYRGSMGQWDAMRIGPAGIFGGFVPIGAVSEAEAVARVLARHG